MIVFGTDVPIVDAAPGVTRQVLALDDGVLVDVFTPAREDFLT